MVDLNLGHVFTHIFHLFFIFSQNLECLTIIPVSKNQHSFEMNDFRPVALMFILAKCMEIIVCNQLMTAISDHMEPLHFAYKAKRDVYDACLSLLNSLR